MPVTRKRSVTAEVTADILRLHQEGRTPQEISDLTSVSHAVVMTVLHDAKLSLPVPLKPDPSSPSPSKEPTARKQPSVIPAEDEQKLVDFLVELDQFNLNWRVLKLRQVLQKYAIANGLHESCQGTAWMRTFMERHSDLITDVPETTDAATVAALFYNVVGTVMAHLQINNRPECVWNMELVSCCASKKNRRVFAVKTRRNGKAPVDDPTETAKAICAISAAGKNASPALILPGGKVQTALWSSELPEEVKATVSYLVATEEQNHCHVALRWLQNVFTRDITERPILMFVDSRYGTVDCLPLISWAKEENIHLMCVPSECADVVRPLDIAARWTIKKQWHAVAAKAPGIKGPSPKTPAVVKAFITAYVSAMTEENVKAVFNASGLFPLNQTAVTRIIQLANEGRPLPSSFSSSSFSSSLEDPSNHVADDPPGEEYQEAVKSVIDVLIKEGRDAKTINKLLKCLGVAARLKVSS